MRGSWHSWGNKKGGDTGKASETQKKQEEIVAKCSIVAVLKSEAPEPLFVN